MSDSAAAGIPAMQDASRSELEATRERAGFARELAVALQDTLRMLRAAHMDSGTQHATNPRVIKATAALSRARALGLMGE
jgi:hypothetical protein